MINKFFGWGRKCYYSYSKIDKNIRIISYVVIFAIMFSIFIFTLLICKTKFLFAALLYSLSWTSLGVYFKYTTKYYREYYKRENEIFISAYSKKNSIRIEQVINILMTSSMIMFVMLVLQGREVNHNNIKGIVLFITTTEVIIFIYLSALMNFHVIFYEDFYITTYYIVNYKEISEIKIIKEIDTFDGKLNWCEITFVNGEKGYDKLFNTEFNLR